MEDNGIETMMGKAFPEILKKDVAILASKLTCSFHFSPLSSDTFEALVDNESLQIPERVYFDEKCLTLDLTPIQRDILNTLFSRHHDGHIREQCVKRIIILNHAWVIPYIVRIIGEYVIEILNFLEANLDSLDSNKYAKFLKENPKLYQTTKSRVISYWDCYYRSSEQPKENYVGFRIIDHLDKLAPESV